MLNRKKILHDKFSQLAHSSVYTINENPKLREEINVIRFRAAS